MKKEVLDALIASLNDPDAGWTYTKHYAKNPRIKCDIWIASGAGFLDVDFYGDKIGGDWRSYRVSGELLTPRWARRIYKAARPHQLAAIAVSNNRVERKIVAAIQSASTEAVND